MRSGVGEAPLNRGLMKRSLKHGWLELSARSRYGQSRRHAYDDLAFRRAGRIQDRQLKARSLRILDLPCITPADAKPSRLRDGRQRDCAFRGEQFVRGKQVIAKKHGKRF